MTNKFKFEWKKPQITTMNKMDVDETITVAACSKYSDCNVMGNYIDSIPGKNETM